MSSFIGTRAPSLPTAPVAYDAHDQDVFNNILRLYFTTIDNYTQGQIASTLNGTVFTNVTTAQKTAIVAPKAGQVVFDTTLAKLCVYSGAAWQTITSV